MNIIIIRILPASEFCYVAAWVKCNLVIFFYLKKYKLLILLLELSITTKI
jgi:hypothetical protein